MLHRKRVLHNGLWLPLLSQGPEGILFFPLIASACRLAHEWTFQPRRPNCRCFPLLFFVIPCHQLRMVSVARELPHKSRILSKGTLKGTIWVRKPFQIDQLTGPDAWACPFLCWSCSTKTCAALLCTGVLETLVIHAIANASSSDLTILAETVPRQRQAPRSRLLCSENVAVPSRPQRAIATQCRYLLCPTRTLRRRARRLAGRLPRLKKQFASRPETRKRGQLSAAVSACGRAVAGRRQCQWSRYRG